MSAPDWEEPSHLSCIRTPREALVMLLGMSELKCFHKDIVRKALDLLDAEVEAAVSGPPGRTSGPKERK